MRAVWLAASIMAVDLALAPRVCMGQAPAAASEPAVPSAESRLEQGLALFKERKYAAAADVLEKVRQASAAGMLDAQQQSYALLLLGICYYRLDQPSRAEQPLREAARSPDAELRSAARVFLGMVFSEEGAADRARTELVSAAGSPYLKDAAERLLRRSRPHRLQITLLVSPEFDGNVALTPLDVDAPNFPAWRPNPQASMDGDVLLLASLGVRPLAGGLFLGNTFSYRQQFRLFDYNLLLDSTWLGYSYLGPADRLRLQASFNFALLGGNPLFLDGTAKAWYRRRLVSQLGLSATYDVRYRDYMHPDYQALTGLVQSLQLELGWGLGPQPVSFGLAYQGLREQTQVPDPADPAAQDFRAWAHGPSLWLRARLHKRVELSLTTTFLHRVFDSYGRIDFASYNDLSLNVSLTSWLEGFVGGGVIYNDSSEPLFHYVKPTAAAGLAVHLGLL